MSQHVVENLTVAKQSENLTEKDLDATVTAFNELDFQPVVTASPAPEQHGAPAHGRVVALRRVGKKLVATVETAHASIADALRNGTNLTASLFHNLKRGGRQFRRVLKSINLHGITEPGDKLKPSGESTFKVGGALVRNYALDADSATAGDELDKLIRKYIADTGETSYSAAMTAVLLANPDLHCDYAMTDNLTPAQLDARRNQNAHALPDVREERQAALERKSSAVGPEPQDRRGRDRRSGDRRTSNRRGI